ncbi:asparagine synthase (glutamine-hydrolyzing) [Pseudochrobactrum sp. sp1633]|uniref:asparagine synthase (glutamine-hydrolyzing) n=1 Tax=Pseudochrobactrum sp. sp1633 TaxID=3036706 RepID=UPI0025A5AA83|nr:asparagine synthase (glutamine-hydrolyzing) [Pseudochrobactrum sp. sp1633]MDM8347196.1 asparagine synthase (glutamine-hydrolyzing) [Pseudochrobactrum sp. sp1633]HWD12310.1 asparagine synthase (glutamine-hydrolyzing) [Pseudochrobactrum sp.]
MCGLAGYIGEALTDQTPEVLLRKMADAIAHRGPDEQGAIVLDGAGLAHKRLSIVGISDGQQPMSMADQRTILVFNGQIFNHAELRRELEAQGARFRTHSDTEVILQLYARYGADCLHYMNGDFAFALWDAQQKRMFIARDRMGVRPLFYTTVGGVLYFASEIKALLRVPGVEAELDPLTLDQIFSLWAPVAPRTAFRNIFELEPAHMMICDENGMKIRRYWSLDYPDRDDAVMTDADEAAEALEALLMDATNLRIQADVPVGTYLSGGLDSSLIAALAQPLTEGELHSFSVGFEHADYDESRFQQVVAQALRTHHHSITIADDDISAIFPQVVHAAEVPLVRTAPAPLYRLAQLVHDTGMKAVLTGEGADEVFAGYDIFREAKVRRFCSRQPQSQIRPHLFRKLYPYLPGLKAQTPDYLAAFFGIHSADLSDPLYSHRPRMKATSAAKLFFSGDLKSKIGDYDAGEELASKLPERFSHWHELHQAQYLECRFLLPSYILSSQGDRMAMAHSVETRFPFLDYRLSEFAARLHPSLKLHGLTEKYLLRRVAKQRVPEAVLQRQKQPYRAPDSKSFTGKGEKDYVRDLLSEKRIEQSGYFNAKAVSKLCNKNKEQGLSGFRDNTAYVGILSTQLWLEKFTTLLK